MKHKLGRVCFRCRSGGRKTRPLPPAAPTTAAARAGAARRLPGPRGLKLSGGEERSRQRPGTTRATGGTPENAHWELFHSFENVQNKTLIGTFEGYLPFIHTDRSGGGKGAEYFREESKWRSKSTLANHTFSSLFTDRTLLYNDSLLKAVK